MPKLPAMMFYVGDWLKDPAISACSPLARGVWMDLLCAMHENNRSGQIAGTRDQLARLGRCTTPELVQALADLQTSQAADVTERDGKVTVINRRMHREYKERVGTRLRVAKHRTKGVKHQCNDPPSYSESPSRNKQPTLAEVKAWASLQGVPEAEAVRFWNHFESSGWVDKNGNPIVNARAKLTTWATDNRARPLETAHHAAPNLSARAQPSASMELMLRQKELERTEAAIKKMRDNKPGELDAGRQAWSVAIGKLKTRRRELLAILGFPDV